jgi:hypothetical protein
LPQFFNSLKIFLENIKRIKSFIFNRYKNINKIRKEREKEMKIIVVDDEWLTVLRYIETIVASEELMRYQWVFILFQRQSSHIEARYLKMKLADKKIAWREGKNIVIDDYLYDYGNYKLRQKIWEQIPETDEYLLISAWKLLNEKSGEMMANYFSLELFGYYLLSNCRLIVKPYDRVTTRDFVFSLCKVKNYQKPKNVVDQKEMEGFLKQVIAGN